MADFGDKTLNRKYEILKENIKANNSDNDVSPNLLQIYISGLFNFFEKIPMDYEHKKRILDICYDIRDSLIRSAPEIISDKYQENTYKLMPLMPKDHTDWNREAWAYILNAANEVNKILDEIDFE